MTDDVEEVGEVCVWCGSPSRCFVDCDCDSCVRYRRHCRAKAFWINIGRICGTPAPENLFEWLKWNYSAAALERIANRPHPFMTTRL